MHFLLQHNLLPYIGMLVMGAIIYVQAERAVVRDLVIKEQDAAILLTTETMNIAQTYNEARFKALEGVRASKWKKGKHERSF